MSSSLSEVARSNCAIRERKFFAYPHIGSSPNPTWSSSTRTRRSVSPRRIRSPVVGPYRRAYSSCDRSAIGTSPTAVADELDLPRLARREPDGRARRDVEPEPAGGLAIEREACVRPPEGVVGGDADDAGSTCSSPRDGSVRARAASSIRSLQRHGLRRTTSLLPSSRSTSRPDLVDSSATPSMSWSAELRPTGLGDLSKEAPGPGRQVHLVADMAIASGAFNARPAPARGGLARPPQRPADDPPRPG